MFQASRRMISSNSPWQDVLKHAADALEAVLNVLISILLFTFTAQKHVHPSKII